MDGLCSVRPRLTEWSDNEDKVKGMAPAENPFDGPQTAGPYPQIPSTTRGKRSFGCQREIRASSPMSNSASNIPSYTGSFKIAATTLYSSFCRVPHKVATINCSYKVPFEHLPSDARDNGQDPSKARH
jgi:hypothetical protein